MSAQPDNIPLNDASLETVSGGYNVLDGLGRLGQSVQNDYRKGRAVGGDVAGVPGAGMGAAVGAVVGVFNGLRSEIGTGVNEAVVGLKTLMR